MINYYYDVFSTGVIISESVGMFNLMYIRGCILENQLSCHTAILYSDANSTDGVDYNYVVSYSFSIMSLNLQFALN